MTFKRSVALITAIGSLTLLAPPLRAVAAPAQQAVVAASDLTIHGTVVRGGNTVPNIRLRVRNVDTGAIVGQITSDQNGAFTFTVPTAGLYVVEAINDDGKVIGAGEALNVVTASPTPFITTVVLSTGQPAAIFTSTALILLAAAGGAAITTIITGEGPTVPPVVSPEH
jgi:hypothetical protein